ncbi:MAG: hypothetical protein ABSF46_04400, partial [Terriglobia bacterium]
GAVNINATFRPTAHAVGYFLAPLRGFRSPGALSKRLWGKPSPYTACAGGDQNGPGRSGSFRARPMKAYSQLCNEKPHL